MKKVFSLGFLVLFVISNSYAQRIMEGYYADKRLVVLAETMSACEKDSDCAHIDLDLCGCRAGGKVGVINKKFKEQYDKQKRLLWEEDKKNRGENYLCPASYHCTNEKPKCYKKKCLVSSEGYIENIMREKPFEEFKKIFSSDFKSEIREKGNTFLESAIKLQLPVKEAEELNREINEYNDSLWVKDEYGNLKWCCLGGKEYKRKLSTLRNEEERLKYVKLLISRGVKPTKSLFDLMLRNDDFKIAEYFIKNTDMPKTIPYYSFGAYYAHSKYSNFKTNSTRTDPNAEKKKQFCLKNGFSIDFMGQEDYQMNKWLSFDGNNHQNRLFLLAFKAIPTDPFLKEIFETQTKETANCPDTTKECGTIRMALKVIEPEYQKIAEEERNTTEQWNAIHRKMDANGYYSCSSSEECTGIIFNNCGLVGESLRMYVNKNKLGTIKEDKSLIETIKKMAKDKNCSYEEIINNRSEENKCIEGKCTRRKIRQGVVKFDMENPALNSA